MGPADYRGRLTAGLLWVFSVGGVVGLGVLSIWSSCAVEYAAQLALAAIILLLLVQDVATRARPEDADSRIPTAPGTVWTLSLGGKLM